MHQQHSVERHGTIALLGMGVVVVAFMGLSLAITTTGTARFATAMGYPAAVGYAVGAILDSGKAILPVGVLMLFARRAYLFVIVLGVAWLGLAAFTWFATSATVGSAIASIERNGTWRMESRSNAAAELADVERRLAALSKPSMPRPTATITEALAGERVPTSVWRDSHECERIRASRYFARECSKILELRQELAAAQDYERLEARARKLREALSTMPIVTVQDPLPRAFAATVGRFADIDGERGIANLLTLVIEIISCFGPASLRVLRMEGREGKAPGRSKEDQFRSGSEGSRGTTVVPQVPVHRVSQSSPRHLSLANRSTVTMAWASAGEPPSNVLPLVSKGRDTSQRGEERNGRQSSATRSYPDVDAHVRDFAEAKLQRRTGTSVGASQLMAAYRDWCAGYGFEPLTQQKFGTRLTALGFTRWRSCGLIRYRDVQIAA